MRKNWRTVVLAIAVLGLVLSLWVMLSSRSAKVPPRPTAVGQTVQVGPEVAPTEVQRQAAEAEAKAEATAKQDERSRKAESERKLHPFLTLLLIVVPLIALFGYRSTFERKLEELVSPKPSAAGSPAVAVTRKPRPSWLLNVIWAYDALIAAFLVKGIVSPLLNRIAVGMGGWYAFSRGDFPGKAYYYDALKPWAPSFWLWLALTVAVIASYKTGQKKDSCDKHRWDRVAMMAIWGMIAIVSLVFVSFIGATVQWGHDHPKPVPVVAPAGKAESEGGTPSGANLPDVPARDLFGQRSFTIHPKDGDQPAPKGGIYNP